VAGHALGARTQLAPDPVARSASVGAAPLPIGGEMSETLIRRVDLRLSRRFTKSDDSGSSLRRVREQSTKTSVR
jgi:predicted signal transduction protein with EAL and GGDEF domain